MSTTLSPSSRSTTRTRCRVAYDMIAAEAKLLAALRFRLHVFHPFSALRGFLSVLSGSFATRPRPRRRMRVVGANLAYDTALDHSLILPPALAHRRRSDQVSPRDGRRRQSDVHSAAQALSPRAAFLAACGFASLADPAFDKLRTSVVAHRRLLQARRARIARSRRCTAARRRSDQPMRFGCVCFCA
jgi:hypothetical protein